MLSRWCHLGVLLYLSSLICYLRCVPGSYRFGIGGRSVANRSLLVGIRSVLGRLSDGNWCFPLGFQSPKWGARKYYLHSPQPESGRCGLQVILLDLEKRKKLENNLLREPPGPPETADLGGSAQASMLLLVGFAFLRSGSYQRLSETSYGFR